MAEPFVLRSTWLVETGRESLWDTLEEQLSHDNPMPWWHAVTVVDHRGDELDLVARSAFGYRLRFTVDDLRLDRPRSMRFTARGDLDGTAVLTFVADAADRTRLEIVWKVVATPRWMTWTDAVLRPAFVLAHDLVMRSGQRRLNRWLAARG